MLRLSGHGVISKEIDRLDAKYKGSSGKPIQGAGRQDLVNLARTRCTGYPPGWRASPLSSSATQAGSVWATGELTDMRDGRARHADDALAALDAQTGRGDAVAGAAAVAARDSLAHDVRLARRVGALPPREPSPTSP